MPTMRSNNREIDHIRSSSCQLLRFAREIIYIHRSLAKRAVMREISQLRDFKKIYMQLVS